MDPEGKKFGRGPRELTGAVDLISQYKLLPHHEFFCKKSLPLSISDAHYLHNVPFDLDILGEAFQLRETAPIDLPHADKGIPTIPGKSKGIQKDKEKKHKKHKDRDKEKDKEHKKRKHRHKDRSKDKDKEKKKDRSGHHDSNADPSKKHHEKKRKHDGDEDLNDVHKHKKSKHKSSKIDDLGAIKVAG
ncbi:Mediator of RNA polymerase II transcription subunit 19a like [Quillaja saponaria]|uniref:Mediator of RNA polymerase II transcription subunit 19a like n=1 Tax=Quillaja saponaria TaxID=32244 RepID=A0AAD7L318_QUISA|nr:Mediator of RNA polymerase II transcription subunit 19a like [Quillaja saponaria]